MKVLRYRGPGELAIESMAVPDPRPGEVLVQVAACGICSTDLKTYRRGHPKIAPGAVLGHEIVGVIARSRADGWQEGDRVVVAPYAPCLACRACERSSFTLCEHLFDALPDPGGFSEFVRVPERLVERGMWRVPEGLDLEEATLAEPIACSLHGIEALDVRPGQRVLVIGDGVMGLLHAALARAAGAWVALSGRIPERLAIAAEMADVVLDTATGDLEAEVLRRGGPADRVAVTVPDGAAAQEALALVAPDGVVSLFAGFSRDTRIAMDPNRVHYDQVRLVGSFGFAPHHFRRAIELLADGSIAGRRLITHRARLEEGQEAFEAVAGFRGVKTLILPQPGGAQMHRKGGARQDS
ncbi:MAG: alcohol dehydrogenase catalytic domain-containing protein [Chloroflexi bacterium]|nr:alcohol dehydrogenase catalytic domain-containing protein [Chloroflexota bacterium]